MFSQWAQRARFFHPGFIPLKALSLSLSLHRANFITLVSSSSSCIVLLRVPFSSERGPSSLILGLLPRVADLASSFHPSPRPLRSSSTSPRRPTSTLSSVPAFFSSTFAPRRSPHSLCPFRFTPVLPLAASLSLSSNIYPRLFASLTGYFPSARPSFELILPPNFALHCDPRGGCTECPGIAMRLILIAYAEG